MALRDDQIEQLKADLDESRVKQVSTGGRAADYLETYDVIDAANRIFGFDGWSFELLEVTPVHAADRDGVPTGVLYMAKGRLRIGDAERVDVGTNDVSYVGKNSRSSNPEGYASPDAFETAIKGAVSDCLKRCFRTFGSQFGNSLYDKQREKPGRQQAPRQQQTAAPKKERTVDDLLAWALKEYKLGLRQVLEIVGVETKEEIADLKAASDRVKAYAEGRDVNEEVPANAE